MSRRAALGLAPFCALCLAFVWTTRAGLAQAPAATAQARTAARTVGAYSYTVVREYHRDSDAYTQGFVFHRGHFFEGTGLYGESVLREVVLENGRQRVLRNRPLPDSLPISANQKKYQGSRLSDYGMLGTERTGGASPLFGEGITVLGGRIYQLTWVEGVCLVWDIGNWNNPARIFHYAGEGWGLTHDGTHLIMSDGSASLAFRNPETFAEVRRVTVRDPRTNAPIINLNELEYVDGKIYANIYETRRVVIIDPKTGLVEGYVYFDGNEVGRGLPSLLPSLQWNLLDARGEVLNGIAYDPATKHLFITGKHWPSVYEVTLRRLDVAPR